MLGSALGWMPVRYQLDDDVAGATEILSDNFAGLEYLEHLKARIEMSETGGHRHNFITLEDLSSDLNFIMAASSPIAHLKGQCNYGKYALHLQSSVLPSSCATLPACQPACQLLISVASIPMIREDPLRLPLRR